MHSPDFVLIQSDHYNAEHEPWIAEITPVDLRNVLVSLELKKDGLFADEPALKVSQNTSPYKTESLDFDGNCFFRNIFFVIERIWDLLQFLYPSILSRVVSLAVSVTTTGSFEFSAFPK